MPSFSPQPMFSELYRSKLELQRHPSPLR